MIAAISVPRRDACLLGGDDVHTIRSPPRCGSASFPTGPSSMTSSLGAEFLRFVAGLYGQEGDAVERRIAELLEVFELTSWKDELSKRTATGCARS